MTKVNVSATVGMSATVGEMSATVGECLRQWGKCLQQLGNVCDSGGNVCDRGGNVCNSGEIEYALRNLRLEIAIHNFAGITFEDTWNNMSKAH